MYRSILSFAAVAAAQPALAAVDADGTVVVTASRSGEAIPLDEVPSSVTVITAEDMADRQVRAVSDVLRDVPGVAISRAGNFGGYTQARLRGSEANHVLVLIDGIKVSDPFQGEFDFGTLLADPDARIEIVRGQQSSLWGSDAIGGIIHYITASGADAPGMRLSAEGGSFGTVSGSARAAGASDAFDYALSAAWFHSQGTPTAVGGRRDIGVDNGSFSGKFGWTPLDGLRLSAVVRYMHTAADNNNSDGDPTRQTFGRIVDSPGVRFTNNAFHALVSAEYSALDGRWINALSGQFTDVRRRGRDAEGPDSGDDGRRWRGSFTSSLRLATGAITHRITAAVDAEREEYRNATPSPFAFDGWRDAGNVGLVGQYGLTAGGLVVGASIRQDLNNRFADTTTWRVEGSQLLPLGTRLHGAYGTGVKNPGFFDLFGYADGRYIGNPALRPERSKGWEAGVEQRLGRGTTLDATWFKSRLTDEIRIIYTAPAFTATPVNRDTDSTQEGLEIALHAQPHPQLRFDAAYTWLRAREGGLAEVRRPAHTGSFDATVLGPDQRLSATLTLRYNGRQTDLAYTDPSYVPLRVALPDYVLLNLGLRWQVTDRVALHARVENLLGERYQEIFSYQAAGRSAMAGLSFRL